MRKEQVMVRFYPVGEAAKPVMMGTRLQDLQAMVNGVFECVFLYPTEDDGGVLAYMNENGKFLNLRPNRELAMRGDVIVGDFFVGRHNADGELVDLQPSDTDKIREFFSDEPEDFDQEEVQP